MTEITASLFFFKYKVSSSAQSGTVSSDIEAGSLQ